MTTDVFYIVDNRSKKPSHRQQRHSFQFNQFVSCQKTLGSPKGRKTFVSNVKQDTRYQKYTNKIHEGSAWATYKIKVHEQSTKDQPLADIKRATLFTAKIVKFQDMKIKLHINKSVPSILQSRAYNSIFTIEEKRSLKKEHNNEDITSEATPR